MLEVDALLRPGDADAGPLLLSVAEYAVMVGDADRARRCLAELAAKEAGWGKQLPKGQGLGIAAHRSFVTYVATVVHVVVGDKGRITIPRVDTPITITSTPGRSIPFAGP